MFARGQLTAGRSGSPKYSAADLLSSCKYSDCRQHKINKTSFPARNKNGPRKREGIFYITCEWYYLYQARSGRVGSGLFGPCRGQGTYWPLSSASLTSVLATGKNILYLWFDRWPGGHYCQSDRVVIRIQHLPYCPWKTVSSSSKCRFTRAFTSSPRLAFQRLLHHRQS